MRRVSFVVAIAIAFELMVPTASTAHHILGVPHYAYDEDYPQTPVLTYRAEAGHYEVKTTAYPGEIVAGEPVTLHVYVRDLRTGAPYDGSVTIRIDRKRGLAAPTPVYGPINAELDERIYKFHPVFPVDARYRALLAFRAEGQAWTVELPLVIGEPASPWTMAGWVGAAVALLLFVGRAVAIKARRRRMLASPLGVSS
jgi:hypothetical protein